MDKSAFLRLRKFGSACLGILTELLLAAAILAAGFVIAWIVTFIFKLTHS